MSENKLLRVRFYANGEDPRPVNWPVKYPYWVTGYTVDGQKSTIVSYANNEAYILENWPEATDLQVYVVDRINFSDRFPKPGWYKPESNEGVL